MQNMLVHSFLLAGAANAACKPDGPNSKILMVNMAPEQKQKTPEPLKSTAARQVDAQPPFRAKTPLPEPASKSNSSIPISPESSEPSGSAKTDPVADLKEVVGRAIDDHMDGQIEQAVVDHNATVPISVEELRKRGLLT
jgi:hypothetical protein